jgi:hypothetical protein
MTVVKRVAPALLCLLVLSMWHCAGRVVTATGRQLQEADSLFNAGDYVHAKMAYNKVVSSRPGTEAAREAQYRLGYLYLYYNNPFADWEAALREFLEYQAQYPDGRRIEEVNTWISLLHAIQSYQEGYDLTAKQARNLESNRTGQSRKISTLTEALLSCEAVKDSLQKEAEFLSRKVKDLEELILKLQ